MNLLRLTALSTISAAAVLIGCGADVSSSPSSSEGAMETSAIYPPMNAFRKRLKFARLPSSVSMPNEADLGTPISFDSVTYPAFKPNVPQVITHGGPTLSNPRVVTITWDGDANRDAYEAFGDGIGATKYWRDNTSEYGVGKAVSGPENHVHIHESITTIGDDQIDEMIRAAVKNTVASGWPVADQQTIYNVFLPPNALRFGTNDACNFGIGGYHTDSPMDPTANGGPEFMYAININCPAKWDIHTVTLIASHEIVESVTDPFPSAHAAYVGFDDNHLAYDMLNQFQDEVGDACEFFKSSEYVGGEEFPFGLQRNWSNKSAADGHSPCVPLTRLPYFNVTTFPEQMDQIPVDLTSVGDTVHTTAGYFAALNQPRWFDIGFYSDNPTEDWTVWAKVPATLPLTDNNGNKIANGKAMSTIDSPTGQNGHKTSVSVTPLSYSSLGVLYVELHSVLEGGEEKVVPLFLASPPAPPAPPVPPPTNSAPPPPPPVTQ